MPEIEPMTFPLETLLNAAENSPDAARIIIASAPADYEGPEKWAASIDVDGIEYIQNGPDLLYVISQLAIRYQEDTAP